MNYLNARIAISDTMTTKLVPLPGTYPTGLWFRAHSATVWLVGESPELAANKSGKVRLVRGKLAESEPASGYGVSVRLEDGRNLIVYDGMTDFKGATVRADDLNRIEE